VGRVALVCFLAAAAMEGGRSDGGSHSASEEAGRTIKY
jgi:hypothetical protein